MKSQLLTLGLLALGVVRRPPSPTIFSRKSLSATMALDPSTHKIYLPCANYEATTNTTTAAGQRRRQAMIPGSFKLLVYGMDK